MRNLVLIVFSILMLTNLRSQDAPLELVLVNYDVQLSLEIIPELDKRKLVRDKDKKLYNDIRDLQYGKYRKATFPFFRQQFESLLNLKIADINTLEGKVNYKDHIPFATFPKRAIKKKCKEIPYEYFVISNSLIKKPVLKMVSNLWTVETKIKVVDKAGNEVVSVVEMLKMDKPIRRKDFNGGFDKLYREHYDQLYKTLEPYIQTSLTNAISKVKMPI